MRICLVMFGIYGVCWQWFRSYIIYIKRNLFNAFFAIFNKSIRIKYFCEAGLLKNAQTRGKNYKKQDNIFLIKQMDKYILNSFNFSCTYYCFNDCKWSKSTYGNINHYVWNISFLNMFVFKIEDRIARWDKDLYKNYLFNYFWNNFITIILKLRLSNKNKTTFINILNPVRKKADLAVLVWSLEYANFCCLLSSW